VAALVFRTAITNPSLDNAVVSADADWRRHDFRSPAVRHDHDHKYDPLTQEDFFRAYAILDNTADADRDDEAPVVPVFAAQARLADELAALEAVAGRAGGEPARIGTLREA
jgi:hypothetical protein